MKQDRTKKEKEAKGKEHDTKPQKSQPDQARKLGLSLVKAWSSAKLKRGSSTVFHIIDMWVDGDGYPPYTAQHGGLSKNCSRCRNSFFTESYRLTIVPGVGVSLFVIPETAKKMRG